MSDHGQRAHRRLLSTLNPLFFGISWILLGLSRLAIVGGVPVTRLVGRAGGSPQPATPSPRDQRWAGLITRQVDRAAARTPWRSECYPQAVAARLELIAARVPHTVFFGLRRDENRELVAHAWVQIGDRVVIGGDPVGYTVVAAFSWPNRPRDVRMSGAKLRLLRPHAAKRNRAA
jgi:Transglutaminase-like superfamily